ncbi:MAG: class I SAM-dependent RNA methyltransferase [Gemmatimonadetes bacterium]|nr:class I SAM-dependent RNA methyltransferase [Gemmatimonadota bacterium]
MSDAVATRDALADVRVRAIASNGSGVADLPDGRVVFIPRTAPGDYARVRLGKVKRRWAQASVVELLERAPNRIDAPCPLFDRCGGCTLQHLPYEDQLKWKSLFVSDAMKRIGGLEVDPPSVLPSPEVFAYRNRVSYSLRRLRGGRVVAGFHAFGRPAHVIDVADECLLPEASLRIAWTALREGWGGGARYLPPAGRLRLTLRSTGDGVALVVDGGAPGWSAGDLAESVPGLVAIWHRPSGATRATLVRGSEAVTQGGPDASRWVGDSFLQVNTALGDALRDFVLQRAEAASQVVDAYCGVGAYARELARRGAQVTGIEVDPAACAAARNDAPDELSIVQGRVEERLTAVLPTEVLILNPPRSGLHDSVPAIIRASAPGRVIYVSCDPATLARDVARLIDAYTLVEIQAFDLFPQTAHVETVAVLAPSGDDA